MMEAVAISNRYQWDMNGVLRERIAGLTGHKKEHSNRPSNPVLSS